MTETSPDHPVPDDFYRAFEDRFRGSQELIFGRLEAYVPFLRALRAERDAPRGLDLGCGRGEWLQLLEREGFDARGIDLDDGMLQAARDQGLSVENKDAVAALTACPDAAYDVISGFHIVEHLTFPTRLALMCEACRALRPGGLLILETPNPENVLVGTWSFHLDPTHVSPIPPMVMPFLAEYAGFAHSMILRLHTPPPGEGARLTDVFTKVGVDFALVARKAGPHNAALDDLLNTPVGLDIFEALSRFDTAMQDRWAAGENAVGQIDAGMAGLAENIVATAGRVSDLERDLRTDIAQQKAILEGLDTDARAGIGLQGAELAHIRAEIGALQAEIGYLRQRNLFQMLFFRPSGRPVKLLRRLAFHTNGRPRGGLMLGWIARRRNGTPRRAFARWMASAEYAALAWPSSRREMPAAPPPPPPSPTTSAPAQHGAEDLLGPLPGSHPRRYEVWARLDAAQRHAEVQR